MADPLSLIGGILAIATAAAQISKAISRLRAFGEVPSQVYRLKNEVADLEVVLLQVGSALQEKNLALEPEQGSLEQILGRTKAHLTDLAKALDNVANACAGGKFKDIRRGTIWWKWKALFQDFQDDIHAVKETLNVILGASNS